MQAGPLLLGHRGGHGSAVAENTQPAFEHALRQGCDGFEFDVRRTACGCGVVCHSARVGKELISRVVRGKVKHLPRIEDVIRRYGGRGFLDIELKVRGLESRVLSALRETPPEREYVISSFLPEVILELKARSATVPVGIVCGNPGQLMAWRKLPVEYVIVRQTLVTRKLIQRIQDAGRKIFVWTVNDKASMLRLAGSGWMR
jgi:glycerophosphoryl diester phosphodiesterase